MADPDVLDTWVTSSLTPQLGGGRADDPDLFGRVFPMDLRPAGAGTGLCRPRIRLDLLPGRAAGLVIAATF